MPIRLVERAPWERRNPALSALAGIGVGILLSMVIGLWTPAGPMGILNALLKVYTSPSHLISTVLYSGPIVASAAGLSLAYRGRFITIGSEGQVILGSIITIGLIVYSGLSGLHPIVLVAMAFLAAGLLGAVWGVIPGVLRAYLGVNEILSSLMLNYVALYLVNYLVSGPWSKGPFTMTHEIGPEYSMPALQVLIILVAVVLLYEWLLRYTSFGLGVRAYGSAPRAAKTYGFDPRRLILGISAVSGAVAGVGGTLMMLGFQHSLKSMSQPPGYGYMGILVAWLSFRSPLGSLFGGLFFASLLTAGYQLQIVGVPLNTVLAMQAVIVLSVLVMATLSQYRVVWRR